MPVRSLRASTRELMPLLEEMTKAVVATPPEQREFARHLDRLGVIFCYAYYTALTRQEVWSDAVVCDWGGQYGHVSRLMRPYFAKVICYVPDKTEFEVEHFHSLFGVSDIVQFGPGYGVATLPLADVSVDAVISSGVLEHTREFGIPERESLREIYRVLRPGGKLLIWNLPRRWGSVELLNTVLRRSIHPYKYRRRDIVALLGEAGFEITLLDQHELLNLSSRHFLGKLIGHVNAWIVDYYLSKIVLFGAVAQHFTVVAQKP
jgi:SAM-dependent methyltransferase